MLVIVIVVVVVVVRPLLHRNHRRRGMCRYLRLPRSFVINGYRRRHGQVSRRRARRVLSAATPAAASAPAAVLV